VWAVLFGMVCIVSLIGSRVAYVEKLREDEARLAIDLQKTVRRNRELKREMETERTVIREKKAGAAIEESVSALRGLDFQSPVEYKRIPREDLRNYIASKLDVQYSSEEFQNYELALKRMGLIPKTMNLRESVTALLSEQVAAFYDQDEHHLYTFPEFDLSNNMQRMILAHELVHALQDQHFGLQKLPLRAKNNDDASLAAAALVEGDATYQMGVYLRENYQAAQWLSDARTLLTQPMERVQAAPPYLRDSLLFPYQEGQLFVSELHARGGNAAIDAAFSDPPESSEQILHPEKYMQTPRDRPQTVTFTFKPEPEWKKIHQNVVGELGIRALLEESLSPEKAQRASAGWGGDAYVLYSAGNDRWVLVWQTVWDTERDAREFFDAMEELYHARYHIVDGNAKNPSADSVFFSVADQKQNISLYGKTVILLDVPDARVMEKMLQRVAHP